jgi:hypothetical protein
MEGEQTAAAIYWLRLIRILLQIFLGGEFSIRRNMMVHQEKDRGNKRVPFVTICSDLNWGACMKWFQILETDRAGDTGCPIKNMNTYEGEGVEQNKMSDCSLGYLLALGLNYAFESLHPVAKPGVQFRGWDWTQNFHHLMRKFLFILNGSTNQTVL